MTLLNTAAAAALLLCLFAHTGDCFLPVRVGQLSSPRSDYSISGLVYLLDRSSIYIKDFNFVWENTVPGLSLELNDITYGNNSVIEMLDVRDGASSSLICSTNSPTCCRARENPLGVPQGEWYYPNGNLVPSRKDRAGHSVYRSRGNGEVRLNRVGTTLPSGKYCSKVPTLSGEWETMCINLISTESANSDTHTKDGHFCVGYTTDANTPVAMQLTETTTGFNSPYSVSDLELRLPSDRDVRKLAWIGVCSNTNEVIARITVLPGSMLRLPCKASYLGELPNVGGEGISGRVYLVNRVTFAILCFNYENNNQNDAVFLTGVGVRDNNGYQMASFNDDVFVSLGAIEDQDLLLTIPDSAEGVELNYFTVWSRSRNEEISTVKFSADVIPSLPDKILGLRLGTFVPRLHKVAGISYAMNDTHMYVQEFNYDGTGPAVSFRAIRGTHYLDVREYADMTDEKGGTGDLRQYNKEDIVLALPSGYTVHNTDQVIIWCEEFKTSFGELVIPSTVNFETGVMTSIQPQPPTPQEVCPPLKSETTGNCKRLHDDLKLKWVLDEEQNQATFELCGCNLDDQYVAFGLSGRNTGVQMYGSDVMWAWQDNTGVHAQELNINAYSQCNLQTGVGACPEATSNVYAVSSHTEGCTTCFKFTRPITASDGFDKAITPDDKQWVVWAIGPVGNVATPSGIVSIPFKHYLRPSYTENFEIEFGRAPEDECGTASCFCDIQTPLYPWRQEILEETRTISVRIGQSGGKRGYAGITGVVGWGISMYLNGTLIPRTTLYRGFTYTFVTETGNDPSNPARYHPFYITNSARGGYMTQSEEVKKAETIYAGMDSNGNWQGVGRFCYYGPNGTDQADNVESFSEYNKTLTLQCEEGEPGVFTWTPDETTPNEVYYQCATHQYLGWKLDIVKPPPELRPIEIFVPTISPQIFIRTVKVIFETSKVAESVECQLVNIDDNSIVPVSMFNPYTRSYMCNATDLPPARYEIRITVNKGLSEEVTFKRRFEIFPDLLSCGLYLTGDGITFDKNKVLLTVSFGFNGVYEALSCTTNNRPTPCDNGQYSSADASLVPAWNKVCIEAKECDGDEMEGLTIYFNKQSGDIMTSNHDNCSSLSINPLTTTSTRPQPTPSEPPHTTTTTDVTDIVTSTIMTTDIKQISTSSKNIVIIPSSSQMSTVHLTSAIVATTTDIVTMTTDFRQTSTSSKKIVIIPSSSQMSTVHLTSAIVATSTVYVQSTPLPSVTSTPLAMIGPSSSVAVQSTRVAMDTSREGVIPTGLPDISVNIQQGGVSNGCPPAPVSAMTTLILVALITVCVISTMTALN